MPEPIYIAHSIEKLIHISKIFTIHNLELKKGFDESRECHDFWELVYAENGKIYLHNDSVTHYLNKGDIYILKPNEGHYFTGDKISGSNIFIISFECNSKLMSFFEDKILRVGTESGKLFAQISAEAQRTFDSTLNNPTMTMLKKRDDSAFGGDQIIGNLLENLLLTLIREKSNVNVRPFLSKDVFGDELINNILFLLDDRLYTHITLDEIAKKLNYTPTYLSQYFSKVTHYGIIEYYNIMKLNEAKRLMRDTQMTLADISRTLGFCNQHYFSKVFKKYNAVTPRYYRKLFSDRGVEKNK